MEEQRVKSGKDNCEKQDGGIYLFYQKLFPYKAMLGLPWTACNAGDPGLTPGLGRSPGGGHGKPLQYYSLENPMNREAWKAAVHGAIQSQTRLKQQQSNVS